MPEKNSSAVNRTRALTWTSVSATAVALLMVLTAFQPIGLALAAAVLALTCALLARRSGLRQGDDFDGRLSLASAMVSLPLVCYLVFMLNVALTLN